MKTLYDNIVGVLKSSLLHIALARIGLVGVIIFVLALLGAFS
jgi:hypothetical protein